MKFLLVSVPYDSGYYNIRLGCGPPILQRVFANEVKERGHEVRETELRIDVPFPTEVSTSFAVSRTVATFISQAKELGEFPIVFSGNCNAAALGIISGLQNIEGVIWFDAHGDFNTPETSTSGYFDGMSLSMVTGQCWQNLTKTIPGYNPVPENKITLIGAYDLDQAEEYRLHASAITLISPDTLAQKEAEIHSSSGEIKSVYLHIDLDVLDPSFVQVNSYSSPGGLQPDDLLRAISIIKKGHKISGVGFTAYDPSLDPKLKVPALVREIAGAFCG